MVVHNNVNNLSALLRSAWGFPVVPTVDLYMLPRFAALCKSMNFMWKGGILWIDKFCSIFME